MNDESPAAPERDQTTEIGSSEAIPAPVAPSAPTEIAPAASTEVGVAAHFCTGCGGALKASDAFCAHCGRAVAGVPEAPPPLAPPAPIPVNAVVSTPPPAPPALPPAGTAPSGGDGTSGKPGWLIPVIAGAVIAVVALGIGAFLLLRGGGGDETATPTPAASQPGGYLSRIDRSYTQLTRSATATGNSLSTAAAPGDVARVNQVARRQLQVVSTAYTDLSKLPVSDAERPAQTALVRAASLHRRYLALLVRATSIPAATGLGQVDSVQRAGQQAVAGYRDFLRQAPEAPSVITAAGLADTAGLKTALKAKRDAQTAPPSSGGSNSGGSVAPASNGGFRSPAGTTTCGAVGGSVVCRSNAGTIAIDQSGSAYYAQGSPGSGYGVLQYGQVWSNGGISCAIDQSLGTVCSNGGWAFRIRAQDLDINW